MDGCFTQIYDEERVGNSIGYENNVIYLEDNKVNKEHLVSREFEDIISFRYKDAIKGNNSNKSYDTKHRNKQKSQLEEVVYTMDENKLLEKYIDSAEQNRRDMEQRLMEDRRESEKRLTDERRLSEERMEKRFNETMNKLDKLDGRIDKMEGKLEGTSKWITALCITTIVGIAAMAVSVILSIK